MKETDKILEEEIGKVGDEWVGLGSRLAARFLPDRRHRKHPFVLCWVRPLMATVAARQRSVLPNRHRARILS